MIRIYKVGDGHLSMGEITSIGDNPSMGGNVTMRNNV